MTTIKFVKKLECGPEYVAVRIIENCEELKVGNIWLTAKANANDRLAHAQIESVGSKAAEEYGVFSDVCSQGKGDTAEIPQ